MKSLIKVENKIVKVDSAIKIANKLLVVADGLPDLIPYRKGDKWGFCDKNKRIVIDCKYESATYFSQGFACVELNNNFGYIDINNKLVLPFIYQEASIFRGEEGLALVEYNDERVFIDKSGNIVFNCEDYFVSTETAEEIKSIVTNTHFFEYSEAKPFSEGLAAVNKDGQWGYIDKSGLVIIPFVYSEAKPFSERLAAVNKDGQWGYIDKSGLVIIPFAYELADNFVFGIAEVKLNEKLGYIDKKGTQYWED